MADEYKLKDRGLGDLVNEAICLADRMSPMFHNSKGPVKVRYRAIMDELNKRGKKYDRAVSVSRLLNPVKK